MFCFFNKNLYLDFASATPVYPQVLGYLKRVQNICNANPSGLCQINVQARSAIESARKEIAKYLNAQPRQIIFAGSGTQANALAVVGLLAKLYSDGKRDMHVFTTAVEHSSVLNLLAQYSALYSFTVHMVPLIDGVIDLNAFKKMCSEFLPVLISVQYVNNETGIIQPISEIARAIRQIKKVQKDFAPLFHTDAMQAYGENLNVGPLGVDFLTMSGGKLGGPRGCAIVFAADPKNLIGYLGKGSQEFGLFSGTENTYAILGFAKAFSIIRTDWEAKHTELGAKRNYFTQELQKAIPNCEINQSKNPNLQSAHIVSVSIPNTLSEQLVIELDAKGIITSAKSACEALDGGPSHVLKALYGEAKNDWGTVRFSYASTLKNSDINRAVKTLAKIVKKLRDTQKKFTSVNFDIS